MKQNLTCLVDIFCKLTILHHTRIAVQLHTAQLHIQFSQGSAVTDLRWGGRLYSSLFCSSSENAAVKELLKLVNIWVRNGENMKRMFFLWNTVYRQLIGNHTLAFDWCHFWWPWSTFGGHFSPGCHFHVHFSNPWHAFASHGFPELLVVARMLSDKLVLWSRHTH